MGPYSEDLRVRIVASVAAGTPSHKVAEQFDVSVRTVQRYRTLIATTGDLTPGHSPGRHRLIQPEHEQVLLAQLRRTPTATLVDHQQQLARTTGLVVHPATIGRAMHRLGWSRKKGRWQLGSRIPSPELSGRTPHPMRI